MLIFLVSFFYEFVRLCITSKLFALVILGSLFIRFSANNFERVPDQPVPPVAVPLHIPAVSHSIASLPTLAPQAANIPLLSALYPFVRQKKAAHNSGTSTSATSPSSAMPASASMNGSPSTDKEDHSWTLKFKDTVFWGTSIIGSIIALWFVGNHLFPDQKHEKQPIRMQDMKQIMLEKLQHTFAVFNPEVKVSERELEKLSTFLLRMQHQAKKESRYIRYKNFFQAWTKYFIARYTKHKALLSL